MLDRESASQKRHDDKVDALEASHKELMDALKAIDGMWSKDYSGPDSKLAIKTFAADTIAAWKQIRSALANAAKLKGGK